MSLLLAAWIAAVPATPGPLRQGECVRNVLQNYPADFSAGVSSMYKFTMSRDPEDMARFMRGVQVLGANVAPVSIEDRDFVFVVPEAPSLTLDDLSQQVHSVCDLLQNRSFVLVEYQHTVTGRRGQK